MDINTLKSKMNTKEAKQQAEYGRQERAKDAEEVMGGDRAEAKVNRSNETNFALFNSMMYTVDFKECKPGTMEPYYEMYRIFMIHLDRVCREAQSMADQLGKKFDHPTDLAVIKLEKIKELALARSRLNTYAKKSKNIKILS